ncbi:MAG: hypothetical protein LBT97_00525 [Planctomycetota bacterium]|nr:hypothetical protein [Planctomycetota bacterium]
MKIEFAKKSFPIQPVDASGLLKEMKFCKVAIKPANRHFAKIKNACAAMIVIFTNWAFGGLNSQFAKVQKEIK